MGGSRQTRPFPVVISGPSGVGKTTLVERLIETDPLLKRSVSTTTRPPRDGEVEGAAYFFVSRKDFEALKQGQLVEWAQVHDHYYGTPKEYLEGELAKGKDVVLSIDVQGGAQVRKSFADAVLIFILPPSFGELELRIKQRGTDYAKEIKKRMENARREIKSAADYDYIVINDRLEDCVATLGAIITSERRRRTRYDGDFIDRFGAGKSL